MLSNIASTLLQEFFEKNVQRGTGGGIAVTFHDKVYFDIEEGYRFIDLVIYAPTNYIAVFMRKRSNVLPHGKEEYVKTVGKWQKLIYHDSCWLEELRSFFFDRRDDLNCFTHCPLGKSYDTVSILDVHDIEEAGLPLKGISKWENDKCPECGVDYPRHKPECKNRYV